MTCSAGLLTSVQLISALLDVLDQVQILQNADTAAAGGLRLGSWTSYQAVLSDKCHQAPRGYLVRKHRTLRTLTADSVLGEHG